jgi:Ca2+/H+ antiporter
LDEFIGVAYMLIKAQDTKTKADSRTISSAPKSMAESAFSDEAEEEQEDMPEEFTSLPPDQQQSAIKRKAFSMLAAGTFLVVLFSDPMVDVLSAVATRAELPPFYVSFVLAPLASNASEIIASMYYASKKTRKTITVSLTTLEGAASVNNTFCLSIFMGLIFFRGLAWQYSAETMAIILTQILLGYLVQKPTMTLGRGMFILSIFPLSIALVATLEAFGLD